MELRLLLCVILSCLCSAFAIWMAISARIKNSDTESLIWRNRREDDEERFRNSLNYESVSRRAYSLERRVVALEKKTASETKGECCEPCRPRTCCGTVGEKVVLWMPERKCEDAIAENVGWKNQYRELSVKYDMAVEENKRLRETIETIARVSGYRNK